MKYQRITKAAARKLFAAGETVYLCPCKFYPGGMWSVECPVTMTSDLIEDAKRFEDHYNRRHESAYSAQYADLWKGSIAATAWDLMYNNWRYYNTSYEQGYYAHYYRRAS